MKKFFCLLGIMALIGCSGSDNMDNPKPIDTHPDCGIPGAAYCVVQSSIPYWTEVADESKLTLYETTIICDNGKWKAMFDQDSNYAPCIGDNGAQKCGDNKGIYMSPTITIDCSK